MDKHPIFSKIAKKCNHAKITGFVEYGDKNTHPGRKQEFFLDLNHFIILVVLIKGRIRHRIFLCTCLF